MVLSYIFYLLIVLQANTNTNFDKYSTSNRVVQMTHNNVFITLVPQL